jgi:hypothetical protein
MCIINKVNRRRWILSLTILSSCITPYEPIATFEEKQLEKEKTIENYVKQNIALDKNAVGVYESLAYGDLTVYKPKIFHSLDSLYAIKDSLIRHNKQREIIESDLELFIEEYRGKAQEQTDEIRYETEHIYCVRGSSHHSIYSEFFYMDAKDSIISSFEKFHFSIPRQDYNMYKNYLFEMHFTTPRELYISQLEKDFIMLFKSKEVQFYKTAEHQKFMQHTLRLMEIASVINTVDYVSLTRVIGTSLIQEKFKDAEILNIGSLIALEDNLKQVVGYEIEFKWNNKENKFEKDVVSTIEFDPYLRIVNFNDRLEN